MSALLMQISDTHFGTERPPVCDALRRLAHAQRPQVLLLSGDITQRARRAQFAAARAFADSLQIAQWMVLPGNHDIPLFNLPARLFAPYRDYHGAFGQAHDAMLDADGLRLIGLDSTRRLRHVDGQLSAAQIERAAGWLEQAPAGALRVVALHHPVAVTRASERHNRVRGHAEALRRWLEAGVDLVLGGHIHLPFVRPLDGSGRAGWAVQAGTAVSSRTRRDAGNSVNLIRRRTHAGRPICTVERWDYRSAADEFEMAALSALPLGN